MCQLPTNPLTHCDSRSSQRRVSLRARAEEWLDHESAHGLSVSLIDFLVNCRDLIYFPGVLREGHRHLDGGVPSVCVCRPAGICSSEFCLKATQGVHQAEEKAAAAKNSKCKSLTKSNT